MNKKLYVGNLGLGVSEADLQQMFCYHELFGAPRSMLLYPATTGTSATGGAVTIGQVTNTAGQYLNDLSIDTQAATNGVRWRRDRPTQTGGCIASDRKAKVIPRAPTGCDSQWGTILPITESPRSIPTSRWCSA